MVKWSKLIVKHLRMRQSRTKIVVSKIDFKIDSRDFHCRLEDSIFFLKSILDSNNLKLELLAFIVFPWVNLEPSR